MQIIFPMKLEQMRKLSNSELNRISVEEYKVVEKLPIVIVLDNIRSSNNIGSVFRTADAFRIECLHLCGITSTPPNKDIQKTALGSTSSVEWKYFNNTIESIKQLKNEGYLIYSIEQVDESCKLDTFIPENDTKIALVFGNEVKGVEENIIELSDKCIEIPQFGTKHSLNISVSAGIVIWDFFKKLFPETLKINTNSICSSDN